MNIRATLHSFFQGAVGPLFGGHAGSLFRSTPELDWSALDPTETFSPTPSPGHVAQGPYPTKGLAPLQLDWLETLPAPQSLSKPTVPFSPALSNWAPSVSVVSSGLGSPLLMVQEAGPVEQAFSPQNPPPAKEIETRLFAVHATGYLPKSGLMKAGARDISEKGPEIGHEPPSFRPTLHFSLGELVRSHGRASWDDKPYAILMPLGSLKEQMVNINPYDTFILGDFTLPHGATVVVPEGTEVASLPEGVKVRTYPKDQKLRQAVDQAIEAAGGWKVTMASGGVDVDDVATLQGHNINGPEFFQNFLAENDKVGYGTHVGSIIGEAHRFGAVEQCVKLMMSSLKMGFDDSSQLFYRRLLNHHVGRLEPFVADMPAASKQSYAEKMERVKGWLRIVDTDTQLRAQTGKTLFGNQKLVDKLEPLLGDREAFQKAVSKALPDLRDAKPSEQVSPGILAEGLCSLAPSELHEFISKNADVFAGVGMPEFYAGYGIRRTMLLDQARSGAEGLDTLIEKAVSALPDAEENKRPLLDELKPYLDTKSSRLPQALRVLRLPTVLKHLVEKENLSIPDQGALDLDQVVKGDATCRELFVAPPSPSWTPFEQVALQLLDKLDPQDPPASSPPGSLEEAQGRASDLRWGAKSRLSGVKCLTSPLRTARRLDDIKAGETLSLYEQQQRGPAVEVWAELGLAKEFSQRFPSDQSYLNSEKSFLELYLELSASR